MWCSNSRLGRIWLYNCRHNAPLPPLTLGYVYLPALLGISLTSIIAAKYKSDIDQVSKNIEENDGMHYVAYLYMVL